jgi:hypothetical protein
MFGKHEDKKPPVIPWRRSEDNTKMDVRELGWGSADWIHVAEGSGHSSGPLDSIQGG